MKKTGTNFLKSISVIIPSLDPDSRLTGVVKSLLDIGFTDIILVDDGSKPQNKVFFPQGDGITLLVHPENRGKGAALKTALGYILKNRPETMGAITCDGDGQHLAKDALAVCERMLESGSYTLGVRDFSKENVPFKSVLGNRVSAFILSLVSGVRVTDTQTGLRAIPASLLGGMCEVKGDRFEYETNVLLELRAMGGALSQVTIETVYLDENKGSHYRPFADSVRIASLILKYVASSFASFLADIALFSLLHSVFRLGILPSTVIARVFSSLFNFFLNKTLVFENGQSVWRTAARYYALAIPVMLFSAFGVKAFAAMIKLGEGSIFATLIKLVVDLILFLISFRVQKFWVFRKK